MKKILLFTVAVILIGICFSHSLSHNISRGYQKLFAVLHYDYVGLFDSDCKNELSWEEKIFCKNEYASEGVMTFLRNIEGGEKKNISRNRKRSVDQVFFGDKKVIIKSMEFPGFFSNIFRMGMGVNIWNNAHFASACKVPVLKPIALVEKRYWNKTKTFVAYLLEGKVCDKEIKNSDDWFFKIQDLANRLNRKCLIHDDFRIKNMVLLDNGSIQLIDIDKIHYYPRNSPIFRARLKREIRKFNQNLHENCETKKYLRKANFSIYGWKSFMHNLMCAYRKFFAITHYEYVGLNDPEVKKELSWKEKIFCAREYANESVMEFLRNIETSSEKKILWKNSERTGEEAILNGKKVIIKSVEVDGFFTNLFRMGTGVNIWNNAHYAKLSGIPVLKPIALVEKRSLFKTKTFVVYLFEGTVCDQESIPEIKALRELLQKKLVAHHDFYIRNIIKLDDGTLQLIDIDKMHWYPHNSYLFRWKGRVEEQRFNENIANKFNGL